MEKIISNLLERYPELMQKSRGVPFVGKRSDNKKFSNNVKNIADSYSLYTDKLFKLRKYDIGYNDCKLDSGDPMKYPVFPQIMKKLKKLKKYSFYRYPRASGDSECRKIISQYLNKEEFIESNVSESNIIFTISTTHAFDMIMRILSHPNDVVIFPSPNYGLFALICERYSVNVEFIELKKENNYIIDPEELRKKINTINRKLKRIYKNDEYIPKVIAFFNANPNNPLGTYIGKKDTKILDELGKICKKNEMFLIDDLVYKDLIYDRHDFILPVGYNKLWFDNTISLYGLSKSFGGAGLRAGFVVANSYIIQAIKNIIFQEMDSTPIDICYACAGAYNISHRRKTSYRRYFKKIIKKYKFNFNLLNHIINGNSKLTIYDFYISIYTKTKLQKFGGIDGISILNDKMPDSGFFALVDFTGLIDVLDLNKNIKEESLLKILYSNTGIKYIMGKSMGWKNKKQFIGRINYGESISNIINSFIELKKYIDNNKKERGN